MMARMIRTLHLSLSLPLLGICVLTLFAACKSAPEPPEPVEPDLAFERQRVEKEALEPRHDPFVRLVDTSRLRVGMTKEEVLAVFPDPERIEISPRDREVWRYDFAQLHFKGNRLEDWFNTPKSGM